MGASSTEMNMEVDSVSSSPGVVKVKKSLSFLTC